MFWLNTKRILRSGFVSFWRNGFVSLSSVLVMTVTLFTLGSLLFLGAILESSLDQLREKVDVNVYFVPDAPEDDIFALQRSLEDLPEVETISYTSREEALAAFRERHADDQLTIQALDELSENPLGANLSIQAKETSQYESIANFLDNAGAVSSETGDPIIDTVNFFQNRAAIEKLTEIINASERFGTIVILILAISSILITFNTIRLAIYTSRDEVAVMRLVGASNWYIRGPFVINGIMYGIGAAFVTLVLFYPLTLSLGPVTESFFGNINIFQYYLENFTRIFLIILAAGVGLGAISSYLAVRKYLKV